MSKDKNFGAIAARLSVISDHDPDPADYIEAALEEAYELGRTATLERSGTDVFNTVRGISKFTAALDRMHNQHEQAGRHEAAMALQWVGELIHRVEAIEERNQLRKYVDTLEDQIELQRSGEVTEGK